MIEQLLAVSGTAPSFNPPAIIDNSVFKGFVPAGDLITGSAIASLVGLTAGTVINDDAGWLHYIDGTTEFYIARKNIRFGMTVADLIAAGLIAGKVVNFKGDRWQVRLMSGMSQDPFSSITSVASGGEWNKYMYPIYGGPNRPAVTQWSSYTTSDLGLPVGTLPTAGTISVCRDRHSTITTALAARGWSYNGYEPNTAPVVRQTVINDANGNEGNASQGRNVYGFRPMLTKLPPVPTVDESGPGPQVMEVYDEATKCGYYGTVSEAELFSFSEVDAAAKTPLPGTVVNRTVDNYWLKFYWKGKITFVPRRVLRTGTLWADIYRAGMVYGVDGNGRTIPATGAVNQLTRLSRTAGDGSTFTVKVRAFNTYPTDPYPGTLVQADVNAGEYFNTRWRLNGGTSQAGWPSYWGSLGTMAGQTLGIETSAAGTNALMLNNNGNYGYVSSWALTDNRFCNFYPVLELESVVRP